MSANANNAQVLGALAIPGMAFAPQQDPNARQVDLPHERGMEENRLVELFGTICRQMEDMRTEFDTSINELREEITTVETKLKKTSDDFEALKASFKLCAEENKNLQNVNEKLRERIRELEAERPESQNLRRRRCSSSYAIEDRVAEFVTSEHAESLQPLIEALPETKKWGWKSVLGAIIIGAGIGCAVGVGIAVAVVGAPALIPVAIGAAAGAAIGGACGGIVSYCRPKCVGIAVAVVGAPASIPVAIGGACGGIVSYCRPKCGN